MTIDPHALRLLPGVIARHHAGARPVAISDETVRAALGLPIPEALTLTFPAGETHKNRGTWSTLTDQLIAVGCDRHTVLVAFGGGVTTDLVGFVAATALRGLPWIAVPTTTLAMIDATVGGKTGVNTPHGKNLVGAFHPPTAVLCDLSTLATLPDRTYREGLAEAVKHAAALDAGYGAWIAEHASEILARQPDVLVELIHRSVTIKSGVVSSDEHERGRRAVLNVGHTVAHALERASGYQLAHGEAVAIGLVCEARAAERFGIAAVHTADRIAALLTQLELPTNIPATLDRATIVTAMQTDKKNRGGAVHASLLADFGAASHRDDQWTTEVDPESLIA